MSFDLLAVSKAIMESTSGEAAAEQLVTSWIDQMSKSRDGRLAQHPRAPVVEIEGEQKKGQLVYEAMHGSVDGVRKALAEGQSVNTEHCWRVHIGYGGPGGDTEYYDSYYGLRAVFAAAVSGHWEMVRILAEQPGIDMKSSGFSCRFHDGGDSLFCRLRNGWFNRHSSGFQFSTHDAVMKLGGSDEVEKLNACIPVAAWRRFPFDAFEVSGVRKIKIASTAVCNMLLSQSHEPLIAIATRKMLGHPDLDINVVDGDGSTALMIAASTGRAALVTALMARPDLDCNVVEKRGITPLMRAVVNGHVAVVAALQGRPELDVNAIEKDDGNTALMLSVDIHLQSSADVGGHAAVVAALLGHSAVDVNIANKNGKTALMIAADKGLAASVAALLGRPEMDVNMASKDGRTALMFAAGNGHSKVVTTLLGRPELDVKLVDNAGDSALVRAAQLQRAQGYKAAKIQICTEILRKDPRAAVACKSWDRWLAKQGEGHTTIMWAVGLDDLNLVEAALAVPGADPAARRKDGKSARDMSM